MTIPRIGLCIVLVAAFFAIALGAYITTQNAFPHPTTVPQPTPYPCATVRVASG